MNICVYGASSALLKNIYYEKTEELGRAMGKRGHGLAQALVDFTLTYSPKRIVLGGGVMHQKQLFAMIREKYKKMLNHYVDTPYVRDLDNYIVPYSLNDDQGIMGCIRIGLDEMKR